MAAFARCAVLVALAACNKTWQVETLQPRLTLGANLDARTSLTGVISLRDMELPRSHLLANSAYFVAVSRDRLRFHVTLLHKWEEIADPAGWRVWIEDDLGRRLAPDEKSGGDPRPVTTAYEVRSRKAVNYFPLLLMTVYRGEGHYAFHRHDLLRRNMRWLMLVMVRPGYEYRYVWSFGHGDEGRSARKSIVGPSHSI